MGLLTTRLYKASVVRWLKKMVRKLPQIFYPESGSDKNQEINELKTRLASCEECLNQVLRSSSWRLTSIPRRLVDKIRTLPGRKCCIKACASLKRSFGNRFWAAAKIAQSEGTVFLLRKAISKITWHMPANQKLKLVPRVANKTPITNRLFAIDIVICIHNALSDVEKCLESVLKNTMPPYNLILIDDGSDDETRDFLREFVECQPFLLLRNDTALGYTKAANIGLKNSKSKMVALLNSDTLVTQCWIEKLAACMSSNPDIGIAGPLSNTASWQSVPEIMNSDGDWSENKLPAQWSVDQYAESVADSAPSAYPIVGFLNGFCLLIKREVLDQVGLFDEKIFAAGYGEENDFCLRVQEHGWKLAIANNAYVFHSQSKSYTGERRLKLAKAADISLSRKHGSKKILTKLDETRFNPLLKAVRARCLYIEARQTIRQEALTRFEGRRLLFLLPVGTPGGGSNVVINEILALRKMGIDARIANLAQNQKLFDKFHEKLNIPILYIEASTALVHHAYEFDAIIATLYSSVFWLQALPSAVAERVVYGYYIQDYEPEFFDKGSEEYEQAMRSYTCLKNMRIFTKTLWNRNMVLTGTKISPVVVGPSYDYDLFYPSEASWKSPKIKIVAMVRPFTPRRNPGLTMRILKKLKQSFENLIDISIFGVDPSDPSYLQLDVNFSHKNYGILPPEEVAHLMRDAEIFLDLSQYQAMGLTAIEAMASGVCVVGPIKGGLNEIIKNEFNGLLVDTSNEDCCFQAAALLIKNSNLRKAISDEAISSVVRYFPERAALNILNALFAAHPA